MPEISIATKTDLKLKTPSQWRVLMHNDDFTPLDFVIELLQVVFHKSGDEAQRLAMLIHDTGKAQIGLYTKEVALTKVNHCKTLASEHSHPLKVTAEEA